LSKTLCFTLLCSALLCAAQTDPALEQIAKQRDARRIEARDAVAVYMDLFKKGPSAADLARLGDEYLKMSKPIQAIEQYSRALELQADLAPAVKGRETATRDLEEKNALIEKFQAQEEQENKPEFVCRRAAVLFHLGYMGDAVDIIHEAEKRFVGNDELLGLEATFKAGIAVDTIVVKSVLRDFYQAIASKEADKALTNLAEYQFFSLGTGNPGKLIQLVGETFPDQCDPNKIKAALGVK